MKTQDKVMFIKDLEGVFIRENRRDLILSGLFSLIVLAMVVFVIQNNDPFGTVALFYMAVLAVGLLWLGISLYEYNPERIGVLQAIKKGGRNIIWIYPKNMVSYGIFTIYNVVAMDRNGHKYCVHTKKFIIQNEVISQMAEFYPNALLGYDELTEAAALESIQK